MSPNRDYRAYKGNLHNRQSMGKSSGGISDDVAGSKRFLARGFYFLWTLTSLLMRLLTDKGYESIWEGRSLLNVTQRTLC